MRRLFLLMALGVVATLTSCDGGSGKVTTEGSITDYNPQELNQTIYADETSTGGDFTFTAAEAWYTSVVAQTKAGEVSWVTLDPASGEAGTVNMTITLTPNESGADRTATIKIICGETVITITIEQKATTSSGEEPQPLSPRIKSVVIEQSTGGYVDSDVFDYVYSNSELPQSFYYTYLEEGSSVMEFYGELSYMEDRISYTIEGIDNEVVASLNPMGLIQEMTQVYQYSFGPGSEDNLVSGTRVTTYAYDDNGYLIQSFDNVEEVSQDGNFHEIHRDTYTYRWEGGNCVEVNNVDESNNRTNWIITYSDYENSMNIDVLQLSYICEYYSSQDPIIPSLTSLNGFKSKNLPAKVQFTLSDTVGEVYLSSTTTTINYNFTGGLLTGVSSSKVNEGIVGGNIDIQIDITY